MSTYFYYTKYSYLFQYSCQFRPLLFFPASKFGVKEVRDVEEEFALHVFGYKVFCLAVDPARRRLQGGTEVSLGLGNWVGTHPRREVMYGMTTGVYDGLHPPVRAMYRERVLSSCFLPAAKPSGPRTVGVVLLFFGGGLD